ncbi:Tubulin gamma chain [Nosema granulosis]|uniref:Tubulin gamma chain n=1 Tax=Nosema granulosis TaxID=83296 RepID=A0A9P6H3R5_9MICR|nr:Tubulin gamma chain [Nosema granulosis]
MREIITLQIGQCGNQMGTEFWKSISREHGITNEGLLIEDEDLGDRKDIFYYQSDDNRFIPRALLFDLEPRVLSNLSNLFNKENIFMPNEGGGAGNNWAHGYYVAQKHKDDVLEIIQREVEGCDSLEAFMVCHSIAGGTGSGFGSFMLEQLKEFFPKKLRQTYSIFPNNDESSDVVVQPYNSMLTIERLNECSDNVIVMDNTALGRHTLDSLRIETPTYEHINTLISTVMSASTSTIRFPSYTYSDFSSIHSTLVPFETLKFVIPAYTPFVFDELSRIVRKTTCQDVMRKLYLPKTKLATYETTSSTAIISTLNILNGVEDSADVQKSILRLLDSNLVNFVPWIPQSLNISLNKQVKTRQISSRVSGLSLTNTTGISSLLYKITGQFDKLRKQKAFVDIYRKFGVELTDFDECREKVIQAIENYSKAELPHSNV